MKRKTTVGALAAALTASAVGLIAAPAFAANANDTFDGTAAGTSTPAGYYVGVGSDTTQIVVHDLVNSFNATNPANKLSSFAADGTPSSIFLKTTSASAILRPNGSGAGKALLYAPNNNPEVDFARSSSTLNSAEISGNLLQAPFALDGLKLAVSNSVASNAPATLTAAQIVSIYKGQDAGGNPVNSWDDLGGSSTAAIVPLIPQTGSGTRNFFTDKLKEANNGQAVTLAASVQNTQEHDPTDIANNANAIAPFSTARAAGLSSIKLEGGASWTRPVYNVVRAADVSKFVSIFGPNGYFCGAAGRTVIEAKGFKQLAPTSRNGKCGVFTTEAITNLKTSDQDDSKDTTTALTATANNGKTVTLKTTVAGASTTGSVAFKEGSTTLGTVDVAAGKADLPVLTDVSLGDHTYKAFFTPTDTGVASPSESDPKTVTVKKTAAATLTLTPATVKYAHVVQAKADVTSDGSPAAGGSVQFKVGSTVLKTGTIVNGTVTVSLPTTLTVGTKSVVASYLGSTDTSAVVSDPKSLVITKATSSTSVSKSTFTVRKTARAKIPTTVKIVGGTGVSATGSVTIKLGSKVLAKGTLKSGKVTITLPKITSVGTKTLKAYYNGSSNLLTSNRTFKLKVTR